ncbi:Type I restriction-modification system, specificity subunit S (modular protein) [Nitrosomonas nitrosa]|uniref:Type I restriction-modification system, specificity subunit S (Modular protein) n=1 Tax=Nitrosomonas nitrosa TaxID=52442 RepID=A0A8H9D9M1_9PROT|nr:restriction endonuclease subunit S [Nitrosomonas nitrosa]CAE6507542.1 Type I restriction-modification system, specificity subunit S (modular protein) [Nitrosomonas nitrosa]
MSWESKKLKDICTIRPPKKEASQRLRPEDIVSFVPMDCLGILSKNLTLREERKLEDVQGSYTYFADNDVLLAKITPCFENGKLGIAKGLTNGVGFGSSEFVILRSRGEINPEFLFYFLSQDKFRADGARVMTGAVGHKRIPKEYVEDHEIPLPPLEEQKRIVAILDEAFEGIEKAQVNAEQNLANARELYTSALHACFGQEKPEPSWMSCEKRKFLSNEKTPIPQKANSTARGRAATDRIIEGELSLSVGKPGITPRPGWIWSKLTDLARLESGHTPSRRHPEYWAGDVGWIGIKDAKAHHGQVIYKTNQHTNQLGLDNSAARLLPKDTVCLSRTASVGYVVVMGTEMATSQDFVNWVCSPELEPHFLKYLLLAEGDGFLKYSSGAVHQTIYFPEVKAFHICHPSIEVQRKIVEFLDKTYVLSKKLEAIYEQKLKDLAELKQSLLQKAFSGELTSSNVVAFTRPVAEQQAVATTSPEFAANVLAYAHNWHAAQQRDHTFGRVKAQKVLHMAESVADVDMGRQPIKDAAGPNDFQHMLRAEDWAKANLFFEFTPRLTGNGYDFKKLGDYNKLIGGALEAVKPYKDKLKKIIALMMPMNTREAEVLATVHAAWNNLLLDNAEVTDDKIHEACKTWHERKQPITEAEFRKAITTIRNNGIVPDGTAKRVIGQENLPL